MVGSNRTRVCAKSARDLAPADEPKLATENSEACRGEGPGCAEGIRPGPGVLAPRGANGACFQILRELHLRSRCGLTEKLYCRAGAGRGFYQRIHPKRVEQWKSAEIAPSAPPQVGTCPLWTTAMVITFLRVLDLERVQEQSRRLHSQDQLPIHQLIEGDTHQAQPF